MNSALIALAGLPTVASHGWVSFPVSRLEMAYSHYTSGMPDDPLRWSPQSSNMPNACGAPNSDFMEPKEKWAGFYALAGIDIPVWAPGKDIETQIKITADHGGQSWVMLSCADTPNETDKWTYLERAADDRDHHYMPSSPHIYAWPKGEIVAKYGSVLKAKWTVPADFSCPGGQGVGRWVWKTGNTCNDNLNGNTKKTEPFVLAEFKKLNDGEGKTTMPSCGSHGGGFQNEYFITCFDFSDGSTPPAPAPPPIPPANSKCCFSKWGALDGCGLYPSDCQGGCCNTNWGHKCESDADCKNVPPAPAPSPPAPTPPSPSPVPPAPTPAPTPAPPAPTPAPPAPTPPQPSTPKCCWSNWGDKDTCANYPTSASGARCNTDPTKSCQSDSDCKVVPSESFVV